MDLVVRTSHGEAEISLGLDVTSAGASAGPPTGASIGDVVETVTGRPAPTMLYVDGRAAPSTTPLADSGVLTGSIISTDDVTEPVPAMTSVVLEQVAGPGAGSSARLAPGRHVIGPGRRVSSAELGRAPVDEPMFEVDVDLDGAVGVTARHRGARLDGSPLGDDEPAPWREGILAVGGRAFRLGRNDDEVAGRRLRGSGVGGTVPFNRPPRSAPTEAPTPPPATGRSRRRRRSGGAPTRSNELVSARVAAEREHRRSAHLDPVQMLRYARSTDSRLWERRPGDADAYQVAVGLADLPWTPPADAGATGSDPSGDDGTAPAALAMVPVVIDLRAERAVGVAGSDDFTAGIARSLLVSAATAHGPADLDVVVLAAPDRAHTWEWVKWLPHNRSDGAPRLLLSRGEVERWAAATAAPDRAARHGVDRLTLVVIDEPAWWRERDSPLRPLFADHSLPLRHLALAHSVDDVPSACTVVISQQADERVVVDHPVSRLRIDDLCPYVLAPHLALEAARALAPLEDPELPVHDEPPLPPAVRLLDLLAMPSPTPAAVGDRWARSDGRPVAALGTAETGPTTVDLLEDGPHVVVSGESSSQLVEQLVVSLAVGIEPGGLDLVLVDPAGTMDSLARLPHTASRMTDLDAHGVSRLFRCLQAELRHRERDAVEPRLLVVVDDLDALGGERSGTLASLDDLARRGPDVGVHLVVATSPSRSISDRDVPVEGAASAVVVDVPTHDEGLGPTLGPRDDRAPQPQTGPAVARIGDRRPQTFRPAATGARGGVRPFVVARDLVPMEQRLERTWRSSAGDVDRLVDAIGAAAAERDRAPRRAPVPPPLPGRLPMNELLDRHPGDGVPFALADLPDEQQQVPLWWSPVGPPATGGTGSSLLATGAAGTGTSTLLTTLVLGAATRFSPDDVHVYAIDADTGRLGALAALPHVGAVVGPDDAEGAARLLHLLTAELERRSADTSLATGRAPAIVLVVDDVGALHRDLDGRHDLEHAWPRLEAIVRDGPATGIVSLMTADGETDVPASLVDGFADRLVLDAVAASAAGCSTADTPRFVPGRALRVRDHVELQLAHPPADLDAAVGAVGAEAATERPPRLVTPLPPSVTVAEIVGLAASDDAGVSVPVGLDRATGAPARLHLGVGEHVFVTGPAGSGRSSVLVAIADAVSRAAPHVAVFAAALHAGPLARVGGAVDVVRTPGDVGPWVSRVLATTGPRIVLVDDGDRLAGPDLERLGSVRDGDVSVVVAGTNEALRSARHWSRPLQRHRRGVLLEPTTSDGDLLRVSLGRLPRFTAHTGLLVDDGTIVPLLAAIATSAPTTGSER